MDGSAVKQIQEGVQTIVIATKDLDNVTPLDVFSRPVFRTPLPHEPRIEPLCVSTLQGIIDYVSSTQIDSPDPEDDDSPPPHALHIHVEGYDSVKVISSLTGVHRFRDEYVHAQCESAIGSSFHFGQYYDIETMVIAIQTLFAPSEGSGNNDRESLLKLFSTLTNEAVRTDGDDGVTQLVSTRRGISLSQDSRVPNPVYLRPWRTFREITQPGSPFVLRLKSQGTDKPPQAALFEADGGSWRLDAVLRIKDYLRSTLTDALILG